MITTRAVAVAQIFLSLVFIVGYFYVLTIFLDGSIKTPPEWKDALIALLGVITGNVGTVVSFWFSRSREKSKEELQGGAK